MLTHFSCFSGIGGLDLAAEWAGFETVGQVEQADYPYRVLQKHWPNVPKWRNIEDVTADTIRDAGIEHRPTILSGGFPCQPFSCAGLQKGAADDRYLWPEMLRVVQELRPTWVVGENVAGIIHLALDDVLADLERTGYACRTFVLPAAGVGAPHIRDRVFIVAHSSCKLPHGGRGARFRGSEPTDGCPGVDVSDSMRPGREELNAPPVTTRQGHGSRSTDPQDVLHPDISVRKSERPPGRMGRLAQPLSWGGAMPSPVLEPRVCGVADGVPSRVDRLRALGNAVVPQQAYPLFAAVAAVEKSLKSCASS